MDAGSVMLTQIASLLSLLPKLPKRRESSILNDHKQLLELESIHQITNGERLLEVIVIHLPSIRYGMLTTTVQSKHFK